MSTANISAIPVMAASDGAIARRFLWKEYRVLRGLWISVVVLALLVDFAFGLLTTPQYNFATLYFGTALAAAVLFAVGAAATSFSVEHEEETYGFLSGLPTAWWPVFIGKLAVAFVSAVALASFLALVGFFIGGHGAPEPRDTLNVLGILGVAIVEALAWGTLFSLLLKRPLNAVAATFVAGTTATQLAVNLCSENASASVDPKSYIAAIPLRLAIAGVVLALAALKARYWLVIGTKRTVGDFASAALIPSIWSRGVAWFRLRRSALVSGARWPMFARLLWQTWRESSIRLVIPIVVAFSLSAVTALFVGLLREDEAVMALGATTFFAPALFGALAFAADQRRKSYRFLAEHAGRPRYVWLARHVVWMSPVVATIIAVFLFLTSVFVYSVRVRYGNLLGILDVDPNLGAWGRSPPLFEFYEGVLTIALVAGLAWWGSLTAYAVGQVWSMLLRSEIMAVFTSLVCAIVLAAWVAVLYLWQLSGWLFLLPLFSGLMLATWLRAPAWITERRSWRAWLPAAAAIGLSLTMVGFLLPIVRLAQLPAIEASTAMKNELDWYRAGDTPEARETAAMYLKAAEVRGSWQSSKLLERWREPQYFFAVGGDPGDEAPGETKNGGAANEEHFGIDISEIPAKERDAFQAEARQLAKLIHEDSERALKLIIAASQRPTCRFDFDMAQARSYPGWSWNRQIDRHSIPGYEQVDSLFDFVQHYGLFDEMQGPIDAETKLLHLLTALRMSLHVRSGQPSPIYVDQLSRERQILEQMGSWAFRDDMTEELLREAMDKLKEYDTSPDIPAEAIVADHLLVQKVLIGDAFPLALSEDPKYRFALSERATFRSVYLAYLANRLAWERERGVRALGLITLQNIFNAGNATRVLNEQSTQGPGASQGRESIRPTWGGWRPDWLLQQPAAATSYLTRYEYLARTQGYNLPRAMIDAEVYRRATHLRVALALYRREHKAYPTSLGQLVPDYLEVEPVDPYNGQPFQYMPAGLSLALVITNEGVITRIPPDTPMFWSVGAGNVHLRKETSYVSTGDAAEPGAEEGTEPGVEPPVVTGESFALRSDDPGLWNEPPFIFQLPN